MTTTLRPAHAPSTENLRTDLCSENQDLAIGLHRGAIDQTTITTQPPAAVMKQVNAILNSMGVEIQEESTFRYRCIRAKKGDSDLDTAESQCDSPLETQAPPQNAANANGPKSHVLYGSPTDDSMDEVRFSVELTKLAGLNGTYSLDIRRLKGNLRSYGFIYNTIRQRAELNR